MFARFFASASFTLPFTKPHDAAKTHEDATRQWAHPRHKHFGLINDYMKAFMGFLLAGGAEFSNQLDNMAIVGFEIENNHFVILCG